MLSPKLLETLVDYWRLVRPKNGCFLGLSGQPLTRDAVSDACRVAHRRSV